MKLKHIPALLVSPPSLAPGTTPRHLIGPPRYSPLPVACSRLAGSSSQAVAPRTPGRPVHSHPSESLTECGVASIMPMKLKHIPALLVSPPSLAPAPRRGRYLIGLSFLRGLPLQKGGSARNQRYRASPSVARREELLRQAVECDLRGRAFQATRALPRGSGGAGAFLSVGAVGGKTR